MKAAWLLLTSACFVGSVFVIGWSLGRIFLLRRLRKAAPPAAPLCLGDVPDLDLAVEISGRAYRRALAVGDEMQLRSLHVAARFVPGLAERFAAVDAEIPRFTSLDRGEA